METAEPHSPPCQDAGISLPLGKSSTSAMAACPEGYVALKWLEHAPGFVAFLVGPDLVFAHANDAYKRLVGRDDLVGLPFEFALPEIAEQGVTAMFQNVITSGEKYVASAREIRLRTPDGGSHLRYVDFVIQPILDVNGQKVEGLLILGSDVTMETVSQRDLQHILTHDVLTALPNHAYFHDRLVHALRRATCAERPLQVAVLDLDSFKRVTSHFGRAEGDHILHAVARRLERVAGNEVILAHENGERFLLLLEEEHQAKASARIEELVHAIAEPFEYAGHPVYLTCCAGGAAFPLSGQTADDLLLAADRALARAKEAGTGVLRWDDTCPDEPELERFRLGLALREALATGSLQVHYRAQVDLITGKIPAVEAVAHWTREGENVAPATLVELAKECGLIGALGNWMLRSACLQGARWHRMGFSALKIAVNFSARQFWLCNFEKSVPQALSESGLPGACLDLELTEDQLTEDIDSAVERLLTLKRLGIGLSLDDFGTGYSSLPDLQRLPVDSVKIAGTFLRHVPEDEGAAALVSAIITTAHSLGMRVIAKDVEREAQCEFLSRYMCDDIQGSFVSEPCSVEAMTDLLRSGPRLAPHLLRFNRDQPTLLLVDDEPSILSSLRRLLRNEGYRILTANSGSTGLQLLAEHAVDVIVSDQRMPGMTGVEFLRSVRQLHPNTVRIVLSGFTELQSVTDAVNAGAIYKFLTKPWDDDQLRKHIREAVLYGAMANENRLLTLQVHTANQKLAAVNRQLESLLALQQSEIKRGEISLDIVHEVLSNVPLPVLASDDLGTIVLANRAALDLFAGHGQVLGCDIRHLFPCLPAQLPEHASYSFAFRLGPRLLFANLRLMGSESQSRGRLIVIPGVPPTEHRRDRSSA